jgi:hypothetical protein
MLVDQFLGAFANKSCKSVPVGSFTLPACLSVCPHVTEEQLDRVLYNLLLSFTEIFQHIQSFVKIKQK